MIRGTTSNPDAVFDWTPDEARNWPLIAYHAAGGVVVRGGCVLLLFVRLGRVKLPKGRREDGETLEECAVREVREESGLTNPVIVSLLGTGESRFAAADHRYERAETYYLMTSADDPGDGVQRDYYIGWRPLEEAEAILTYPVERMALRWAIAALHRQERL
jgi:8-oxo-dGTP pyrophosphatase MutT (NUDIX family)